MNYYEHHINDWAEATAHLSIIEDGAYSRLVRKYYALEKPLPVELTAVQRLVGARTKEEKEAVESVLREYFELQTDGWHQVRCDEEIARFLDKRAKAKSSASARWNAVPTHSERTPTAPTTHMRSDSERNANASGTHDERNALQSPDSNLQSPIPNPLSPLTPLSQGGDSLEKRPGGGEKRPLSLSQAEWRQAHEDAKRSGFRKPHEGESFDGYRSALKLHERTAVGPAPLELVDALKQVAK